MKKSVKILSVIMAVVLVFACGVGATLAYLQKVTEKAVVNTFAAKDLIAKPSDFTLQEHQAVRGNDGKYTLNENIVYGNNYTQVVPGADLPKDPFVTVKNQEDAYLFVEIHDTLPKEVMTYASNAQWELVEGAKGLKWQAPVYVLHVNDAETANEYVLKALADETPARTFKMLAEGDEFIHVDKNFQPSQANGVVLEYFGYLVQATGFEDYAAAWNATYGAEGATLPQA